MKRILLIGLCLLILIGCYFMLIKKGNTPIVKTHTQIEKEHKTDSLIEEIPEKDSIPNVSNINKKGEAEKLIGESIKFNVSGILKKGEIEWKEGTTFQFNDFICKIDETKLFLQIAEKKEHLLEVSRAFMQDCSKEFPALTSKWEAYFSKVSPEARLPQFPFIDEELELNLVSTHGVDRLANETISLEEKIEDYYFLAPFDGKIVSVRKKIGAMIKKGDIVIVIQKSKN